MDIKISDHFDYGRLLRFAIAPICMMVFCSIYSVVDGIFIANFVGKNSLAAINIVWPIIMIIGSFGFMLGSGGSAEIAKTIGEGKNDLAKEYFTNIIVCVFAIGIFFAIICNIFIEPICYLAGSSDAIIEECCNYGFFMFSFIALFMVQNAFQTLATTAEKPKIGLLSTVAAGLANIFFDYIFIVVFKKGIAGAGMGTICGYLFGSIIPLVYFARKNTSLLCFVKSKFYPMMILRSCYNGISEMITNIASSIVTIVFNNVFMELLKEDGVAAYSAILYIDFFFKAIYIGFNISIGPIISYNFGCHNSKELKNVITKGAVIIGVASLMMFTSSKIGCEFIVSLFDGNDPYLHQLTAVGLNIYSVAYLFAGFAMFTSSLFTALCNGLISGVISIARGLVLPIIFVMILPLFLDVNGVWLSVLATEFVSCILCAILVVKNRKRYGF